MVTYETSLFPKYPVPEAVWRSIRCFLMSDPDPHYGGLSTPADHPTTQTRTMLKSIIALASTFPPHAVEKQTPMRELCQGGGTYRTCQIPAAMSISKDGEWGVWSSESRLWTPPRDTGSLQHDTNKPPWDAPSMRVSHVLCRNYISHSKTTFFSFYWVVVMPHSLRCHFLSVGPVLPIRVSENVGILVVLSGARQRFKCVWFWTQSSSWSPSSPFQQRQNNNCSPTALEVEWMSGAHSY